MNLVAHLSTAAIALSGAGLWTYGARELSSTPEWRSEPNPLGLQRSPFGQVIALAAQGSIDKDWHGVEASRTSATCTTCGKAHSNNNCEVTADTFLGRLQLAVSERTNPRPATTGHKLYLRRQIENRLRFAYNFDPSNYANYNALHFFLTEPAIGTRPVINSQVVELARETADYCMREESDPRAAITAASAAGNILLLMFGHREQFPLEEMQKQLAFMDVALARHETLARQWEENGVLAGLSEARRQEMQQRYLFQSHIRDAAKATIQRYLNTSSQAHH